MSYPSYCFGDDNDVRETFRLGGLPAFPMDNQQVYPSHSSGAAFDGTRQPSRPTLPRPAQFLDQTFAVPQEYVRDQNFDGLPQPPATYSRGYSSNDSWNAPLPPIQQGLDLPHFASWGNTVNDPFTATFYRPEVPSLASQAASHLPHNRNALTPGSLEPTPNTHSQFVPSFNLQTSRPGYNATDQDFLEAIASRDWSSPSIPAADSPRPRLIDRTPTPSQTGSFFPHANATAAPVQNPRLSVFASARSSIPGNNPDTLEDKMPPEQRGCKRGPIERSEGPSKRRSVGTSSARACGKYKTESEATPDVVDLISDGIPTNSKQKLSSFNCVICMDNAKALTVTHCGHLFCSECLHNSLHIKNIPKKVCPICRQKIDSKPASGKFSSRAKGYYSLELKLMTKGELGKRKS